MPKFTNPLDGVRVAAPCQADWEKMVGDERMRYCDRCSLHVYNLSGMSRREAEALVTNTEGRLCVRFYRRADGTILSRNCPVGLSALKRRAARVAGSALSAMLGLFAGLGLNFGLGRNEPRYGVMGEMVMPARQEHSLGTTSAEDSDPPVIQGMTTVEGPGMAGEWVEGRMSRLNHTPVMRVRKHTRRGR